MSSFSSAPTDRELALVRQIARWLDNRMIDPVLGLLVPGVGDLVSSSAGLVVVGLALKRRMPAVIIARMLVNLAVDAGVGAVPLLGDLFDVVHRAHRKNAVLFSERAQVASSSWRDWLVVVGALLLFLGALALPVVVAVWLVRVL